MKRTLVLLLSVFFSIVGSLLLAGCENEYAGSGYEIVIEKLGSHPDVVIKFTKT